MKADNELLKYIILQYIVTAIYFYASVAGSRRFATTFKNGPTENCSHKDQKPIITGQNCRGYTVGDSNAPQISEREIT